MSDKLHKFCAALLLGSILTSCAPPLPMSHDKVMIERTSAYETTGLLGTNEVVIRSERMSANGKAEVTAACTLFGRGYVAKFNTPATLLLPHYGPASPPITITCALAGKTSTASLAIYNKSRSERDQKARNAGASQGLLGALLAGAVSHGIGTDRPEDEWSYPDGKVTLE